jgi:hypothetical protein
MKKTLFLLTILALVLGGAALAADGTWTGEVLDLKCHATGQQGAAHAGCAVKCLEGGAPMGLLVDGEVVKVNADASDAEAIKTLKSLGGKQAVVTGAVADGVVTVKTAKAAG